MCGKRSGRSLREDGAGGGDSKMTILCIPHSFVENKGIGSEALVTRVNLLPYL